ncbi:MAG: DUF6525 family protein [Pseudomonadota bacterium]
MARNLGMTGLRCRASRRPMQDFDQLPPELRRWVASAVLPWSVATVRKAFDRALAKTGSVALALEELDRRQNAKLEKDAPLVWGAGHPAGHAPGKPH